MESPEQQLGPNKFAYFSNIRTDF